VTEDLLLNVQVRVRPPQRVLFAPALDCSLLAAAIEPMRGMDVMEAGWGAVAALCARRIFRLCRLRVVLSCNPIWPLWRSKCNSERLRRGRVTI